MSTVKKVILAIAAVIVLAIVGLLIAAAFQPDEYRVERSREIAASPEAIHAQISDLERWAEWNPWGELDPEQKLTFSDPPAGAGAWYEWKGNEDVGEGRMEITEVTPTQVSYQLEFIEPFASEAEVYMILEPGEGGESTKVTWAMAGENDFMSKVFAVFADMDAMIGADFEKGLKKLEVAAQGG
jgi:uncharacterized protein YndB with AHSA1/START domain